jgi:hypothetical protein
MYLTPTNVKELIAPRSTFGIGNDSQQWINYLEKSAETVEELIGASPLWGSSRLGFYLHESWLASPKISPCGNFMTITRRLIG